MKDRLHRAIHSASELRAMLVLLVLLGLRVWRSFQIKYQSFPNIIEVREYIRAQVLSSPWFDRRKPSIHWVGAKTNFGRRK